MMFTFNNQFSSAIRQAYLRLICAFMAIFFTANLNAALTDLGSSPLVTTTTGDQVLPNLMYILDNSGSMSWDFMPDYVANADPGSQVFDNFGNLISERNNKCKNPTTGVFNVGCEFGDPPYNSNLFNSIYYNPAIRYSPAMNSTGAELANMNSANTAGWTSVRVDAYGIQGGTSTTSLIPNAFNSAGYPDRVWCNINNPTVAQLSNSAVCKQNSQYIYPTSTFTFPKTRRVHPYYYLINPGEYCTDKNLTNCITATSPSASHTVPAFLRWCNTAARTNCQAKYIESTTHTFAKWSGIQAGSLATGKIKLNPDTSGCGGTGLPTCAAPSSMSISNITINGIRIIPNTPSPALTITDTTSLANRTSLANSIASAINSFVPTGADPDFVATSAGDEVTITPVTPGAFTGTIDVIATSVNRAGVAGTIATGSISFSRARSSSTISNIRVGTTQIMSASVTSTSANSDNLPDIATKVKNAINLLTGTSGYAATCSGGATCTNGTVNISATTAGAAKNGTISSSLGGTSVTSGNLRYTTSSLAGGSNGVSAKTYTIPSLITQFTGGTPVVNTFNRVDIEPTTLSYPKAATRTDCLGSTCTYDEEMTNFANWYSYYRTRMQMMKTSTSRAFKPIDTRYRVGFMTIAKASNSVTFPDYLPIAQYTAAQKANWYNLLFAASPSNPVGTPLRDALSIAGRIYAGKGAAAIGNSSDPIQYSCQQNFALLTTDGYWNGNGGRDINGGNITNLDGGQTPRPMFEGTASSNTLADAAKYYYDTDLRTGTTGTPACTGSARSDGSTGDVCNNNVFVTTTDNNIQQHMTTFTLGLGVDATLTYTSDYKVATEGDFFELKQGTRNWPVPAANSQTAVDDLWHAAVNGQGTYFSAKDPNQLADSLNDALDSIKAKVGAGAAAATSTLNPIAGDNFAYVASYTNVKWIGNLESRTINIDTGKVSEDAAWCVENVLADTCAPPSTIVASTVNSNTTYQCVTPNATASTCTSPGAQLVGTECKVEIASSCTGTLQSMVSKTSDSRNIYMNVANSLSSFTSSNISSVGKGNSFSNSFLASKLSQFNDASFSPAQRALVNSDSLVNYLRGNKGYEDRSSNDNGTINNRLYRVREAVLGDLVHSTPVFVGAPKAKLADPGYGTATTPGSFVSNNASRAGTIYVGGNDGMLHAFNAATGQERWAYVPTMVLDNLWKLADANYGNTANGVDHSYYIDGEVVINDVCTGGCSSPTTAVWKTILVAGLGGGGRGYFALDITNPVSPSLLWEFDETDDPYMGYSFGNPIITKKPDGTWVVLLTSGYNNVTSASDSNSGKGFLYVLNPQTGAVINKYATNIGSNDTPSGLAQINAFITDGDVNNQARFVYGGDLLGNLWRFDLDSASTNPFKVAILRDPSGTVQPITTRPEIAEINGKPVLYVGTGRYLGKSDLDDTQQQTIYAIKDDIAGSPSTLDSPRNSSLMVKQVFVSNTTNATRTIQQPANAVDFTTDRGWYIDFLDPKERQNVPAQLVFGTLLLPTTVPNNTECSIGGYGWLNFLDYKTGAAVSGTIVSSRTNAPIVGMNVVYVKGKPVVNIVTSDNPTPTFPPTQPSFNGGTTSGFTNHRVIWRELITDD